MLFQVYINQILESMVKPWILQGYDFTLKEDVDSEYNKAKMNNIVQR